MRKLTIKNIGAIKHVDLELNRVNVFIGPQSSGKSTISKILCYCMWVEKHCYLNNGERARFSNNNLFYNTLIEYHRLDGYFNKTASIRYVGELLTISYTHSSKTIKITNSKQAVYSYPKIAYIPSERNLVATIPNIDKYNESNDVIAYFGYDWTDARSIISEQSLSEIFERDITYKYMNGDDYILDGDAKIKLRYASSGVLSAVPLYVMSKYLYGEIYKKDRNISPAQRKIILELSDNISKLRNELAHGVEFDYNKIVLVAEMIAFIANNTTSKYAKEIRLLKDITRLAAQAQKGEKLKELTFNAAQNIEKIEHIFDYKYTQLFIEEPEQNLFPKAQMKFVNELFLMMHNEVREHSAVITTHSPYILFAINNCIMRNIVKKNISSELRPQFLHNKAQINPKDILIYQINNGELKRIQDEDGNLDENFINDAYKENSNEYFSLLNFYEDEE
ncbi:MAG: hypothetical protein SNH63_03045 [Rikenellaceae bacterium]